MFSQTGKASIAFLVVILLAGAVTIGVTRPVATPGIEGSWKVMVTTGSGRNLVAMITFTRGGGMLMTEDGGPPSLFNAAHGAWVKLSDHHIAFTWYRFHFDSAGTFLFTLRNRGHIRLERGFQEYFGTANGVRILPDGTEIPIPGTATAHGFRMSAQ